MGWARDLPELRHREPTGRQVLLGVRDQPRADVPVVRLGRGSRGEVLLGVRDAVGGPAARRWAKLDLLVLDELGYVPASKVGAELLFDVISTAYERTSLMVTTNLPFDHWTEVLGSERLTGATLDRLTHRCQIIETKGESYRLRDAKARVRRPGASGAPGPKERPTAEHPGPMEGGPRTR